MIALDFDRSDIPFDHLNMHDAIGDVLWWQDGRCQHIPVLMITLHDLPHDFVEVPQRYRMAQFFLKQVVQFVCRIDGRSSNPHPLKLKRYLLTSRRLRHRGSWRIIQFRIRNGRFRNGFLILKETPRVCAAAKNRRGVCGNACKQHGQKDACETVQTELSADVVFHGQEQVGVIRWLFANSRFPATETASACLIPIMAALAVFMAKPAGHCASLRNAARLQAQLRTRNLVNEYSISTEPLTFVFTPSHVFR